MQVYLNMGEELLTQRGSRAMVSSRGRGLRLSHVHRGRKAGIHLQGANKQKLVSSVAMAQAKEEQMDAGKYLLLGPLHGVASRGGLGPHAAAR